MADRTSITVNPVRSMSNVSRSGDNAPGVPRSNQNLEIVTVGPYNGVQAAVVDDSYYTANSTPGTARGTGIVLGSATGTTYSATNALCIIANTNAAGGPDVVLDYINVYVDTIAGGSPTFWHWYHALDAGNRYVSGTGVIATTNAAGASPSGVTVYAGTLVATAATSGVHDVGHNLMNNGASVANASLTCIFGAMERPAGLFTTPTTGVAQSTVYGPGVVIHPGFSYICNEFWVGRTTSAIVAEFTCGFMLR